MTGGGAKKAMDRLLAAINQGKDPPRRYQPGVTLGFPDLDVFTPEALERIKTLGGGDPARTARLSAHVLKIAQRECAVPVLPDLVDDAAAQIDLERPDSRAAGTQPDHEHSAPRPDILSRGIPLPEPSAGPRRDPGPQTGGAAPSAPAARRGMRHAAGVLGVLLIAAGIASYLAYTGRLDILGHPREIVTSRLAATGVAPPERPEDRSGNAGAALPAERTTESEPPTGSGGEAAVPEDDGQDEAPDAAVAAGHPSREDSRREDDRRADEAVLAEQWPELGEAGEKAIKQRFREVKEQAEQARRSLEGIGLEMEQLHRRQHEEMQARHARELSEAASEGADAVAQAKNRHQQEQAALQRDREANRYFLAAAHDELDQQLQSARRDVARAREEAAANSEGEGGEAEGGDSLAIGRPDLPEQPDAPVTSSPAVAAPLEDVTTADPVAVESGLQPQSEQPQSDKVDDRRQRTAVAIEKPGEEVGPGEEAGATTGENPEMVVVAPGQTEPLMLSQDEASAPVAAPGTTAPRSAERPGNDEEAAPLAGQPLPRTTLPPFTRLQTMPSLPPAGPTPGAAGGATGTAETAAPLAAEAAGAPEGGPATDSHPAAAPAGQDVAVLVNRGNALLDLGDLASARLFYRLAADWGSPEGAMLMGMTFDPVYFARTGIRGTQPQIREALHWYDKAIAMGSRPAERRMGELRSWLERSAAAGDE